MDRVRTRVRDPWTGTGRVSGIYGRASEIHGRRPNAHPRSTDRAQEALPESMEWAQEAVPGSKVQVRLIKNIGHFGSITVILVVFCTKMTVNYHWRYNGHFGKPQRSFWA